MTIPKSVYEFLKFFKDFIPGIATIVTGLLLGLGVADKTVAIIALCVTSLGQILVLMINTLSKNSWKAKAEDGTEEEIKPADTEEAE